MTSCENQQLAYKTKIVKVKRQISVCVWPIVRKFQMFPLLDRPLILYFLLVYAQPSKGEWNAKDCWLSRSDCQRKITWNQVCTCVLARHKHWRFNSQNFFCAGVAWLHSVMKSRESLYFRWKYFVFRGFRVGKEKFAEIRAGSLSRLAASLYRQPAHRLGESSGIVVS